jgi:hypothetical protein
LKERLHDLIAQDIFKPRVIVVDGLDLHTESRERFETLREYCRESGMKCWVAARTHTENGTLADIVGKVADIFDVVLGIEASSDATMLTAYKNPGHDGEKTTVPLDRKTLLLVS